jgi:hypothetical protein
VQAEWLVVVLETPKQTVLVVPVDLHLPTAFDDQSLQPQVVLVFALLTIQVATVVQHVVVLETATDLTILLDL